jgi:hypothetical protein
MTARGVPGPDRRHEAVADVVRDADRVLLVLERGDRDDRTEHLFLRDLRVVRGRDDGGWVERAGTLRNGAAREDLGALGPAALDEAVHPLAVGRRDERSHLRLGIERIADLDASGELGHHGDGLVVERLLHEHPRARLAALSRRVEDRPGGAR